MDMDSALILKYLDTYYGRDKLLRIMSYAAKLATVLTKSSVSKAKLEIFSNQMSNCRIVLRLLDDIRMIHYALSYGLGCQEADWFLRCINLLKLVVDTIYCPLEHLYWAGKHKIMSINTSSLDNILTLFTIMSLYLSLMKSVRQVWQINAKKNNDVRNKRNEVQKELLTCGRLLLDISFMISYLPRGILWGGCLETWHVGVLGSISSLIGLYQALNELTAQKEEL